MRRKKRPPRTPDPSESVLPSPLGLPGEDRDRLAEAESDSAFRWARAAVRDRDVLVVGCGRGHGANALREAGARSVTGTDPDPRAIEVATHLYGERLAFAVAEPEALPFAAHTFGVVVCFDLDETPATDRDGCLSELHRMVAANGLLLVSAPLFRAPPQPAPGALGDRNEGPDELLASLAGRYPNVRSFRRRVAIAAVVAADDGDARSGLDDASWLAGGRGEDRTALVAASDSELPDLAAGASLVSFRDLRTQQEALAAWEQRARQAEADGSAKHWELVAAREAQRRLRMRLHHIEHRPLRRLGRVLRGKPAWLGKGPPIRQSERRSKIWK
jgi:SAM-dependent methyltransferase